MRVALPVAAVHRRLAEATIPESLEEAEPARPADGPQRRRLLGRTERLALRALVAVATLAVLVGVLVSSAAGRVQSARVAWERQDLPAFERELLEVHLLPVSWLFLGDEQAEVFERLSDGQPDDPLVQASEAIDWYRERSALKPGTIQSAGHADPRSSVGEETDR